MASSQPAPGQQEVVRIPLGVAASAAPAASFSSYPNLFYLSVTNSGDRWKNLDLVAADGSRVRSHQALLGATCRVLKRCLLDPKLIPEDQTTIVFPDHSPEEVDLFLRVVYGLDDAKEAGPVLKDLLMTVGFLGTPERPGSPPPSIAGIKSELNFDHTADYNFASKYMGHSILDASPGNHHGDDMMTDEEDSDESNDDDYEYGRAGTEDSNDSDDFLGLVDKPKKRGRKRRSSGNNINIFCFIFFY